MKPDPSERLTDLVARAEHASARNQAQRAKLTTTANAMADRASDYIGGLEARAETGDPDAVRQLRIAARGRTRARRLATT